MKSCRNRRGDGPLKRLTERSRPSPAGGHRAKTAEAPSANREAEISWTPGSGKPFPWPDLTPQEEGLMDPILSSLHRGSIGRDKAIEEIQAKLGFRRDRAQAEVDGFLH